MTLIAGRLTGRAEKCEFDKEGRWLTLTMRWKKGKLLIVTAACNPNFNAEMTGDSCASRLSKLNSAALSMEKIREKFLEDLSREMKTNRNKGNRSLSWDANVSLNKHAELELLQAKNELTRLRAQEQTLSLSSKFDGSKMLDCIHLDEDLKLKVENRVTCEHQLLSSDH